MSAKKAGQSFLGGLLKRVRDRWDPTSQLDSYVQSSTPDSPYHQPGVAAYRHPTPQSQPEANPIHHPPSLETNVSSFRRQTFDDPFTDYGRTQLRQPWYVLDRIALKEYRRREKEIGAAPIGVAGAARNGYYYLCTAKLSNEMPNDERTLGLHNHEHHPSQLLSNIVGPRPNGHS